MRDAGFRTWRTVGSAAELRIVLAGGRLPDDAVSVRQTLLSRDVVAALHEHVPLVIAWTVNRAARARQLVACGVDGITTDRVIALHESVSPG
jgi:glycerophosphoryl diester phosphodiesterase